MTIVSMPIKEYINKYNADDIDLYTEFGGALKEVCTNRNTLLAGGALRRLVTNTKMSEGDFDLYTVKNLALRQPLGYLRNLFPSEYTPASIRFIDKIQLISGKYPGGASSIFNVYDFSVCCFATDLTTLWATEDAFRDVETNTLKLNKLHKSYPKFPKKYRLKKYKSLGYEPDGELMGMIYDKSLEPPPAHRNTQELDPNLLEAIDPYDEAFDIHDLEPDEDVNANDL